MISCRFIRCLAASAVLATTTAQADIRITEVAPTGSSKGYAADWFELTNSGSAAVDITGWKMDDNSNAYGSAVALRGVTSIAAGQSVVFLEGGSTNANDANIDAAFAAAWFGSNVPGSLVLANYGGAGVGLSATADAVNIFDSNGNLVTRVDFNAASAGFSFDNAAGLNNVVLTQLSAVGTNGAFTSFSGVEVGSPGTISAVPEVGSGALMLIGLVGGAAGLKRKARTGR